MPPYDRCRCDPEQWHAGGVGHGKGGKCTQDHHAFDSQVDHPGTLGADFAK